MKSFSSFMLCDLQVHTVADPQQGYGDFKDRQPSQEFAEALINAHIAAGVKVFAVTDHNRMDWYPLLRKIGDQAGVFVFPGVELSVNGCHVLLIWDRTDEAWRLSQGFLPSLWGPLKPFHEDGTPRPITSGQVIDLAKRAVDHHALVLSPHSTLKKMGLLASNVCSNRPEVVASGLIAGYDVSGRDRADVLMNPKAEFGDSIPSWFMTSDCRSFAEVGSGAVYLKLNDPPTLEGIRQAFLAPTTRIRFPENHRLKWGRTKHIKFITNPEPSWPRLVGLSVDGGFHDELRVDFAPGLNAIIGGKGTGKSTLVEIIRYVLDATQALLEDTRGNRLKNFRANSEAKISYITSENDSYTVSRTGGDMPPRITRSERDVDASLVQKRTRIRVFGQRELQHYAQNADLRREFLAWHAGTEWNEAQSRESELHRQILSLESIIDGLESELDQLGSLREQLADILEKLERASEKGVTELFDRSAEIERTASEMTRLLDWPRRIRLAADAFQQVLTAPPIPSKIVEAEELAALASALELALRTAYQSILSGQEETNRRLAMIGKSWTDHAVKERHEIAARLADSGFQQLEDLSKNQQRAVEIEHEISRLDQLTKKLDELESRHKDLINQLETNRRLQSRLIDRAAKDLTSRVGLRVRIRVEPLSDRTELVEALVASVKECGLSRNAPRPQIEKLAVHSPARIASAIRAGVDSIQQLGCTANCAAALCSLPSSTIRSIERTPERDIIRIEINLGSGTQEHWKDVDQASPGQRATAMLALALSSGDEPIIIDQPEDDLDNRYIYEEVVKLISQICMQRQVIVATHNANIPVLGDAELILALDASADSGTVLALGGLEDPSVAYHVRHILEGGDEAFKARQNRYQSPNLSQ